MVTPVICVLVPPYWRNANPNVSAVGNTSCKVKLASLAFWVKFLIASAPCLPKVSVKPIPDNSTSAPVFNNSPIEEVIICIDIIVMVAVVHQSLPHFSTIVPFSSTAVPLVCNCAVLSCVASAWRSAPVINSMASWLYSETST